ncbi:methyltransferase domain-containing protein [Clostridium sp. BJN0013]|uniref:methyltransferase domain-containing protein n=1 Tax=Clostridium sp. BJN0013 TaxID=3236840 RepID=UPI0034C61E13
MCINNIKKKDRIRELIQKNKSFFKCPVCNGSMVMNDFGSLTCNSRHNFDLSKKGYLNLLTSSNALVYSKELFEARHRVCEVGFYDLLIDELTKIIDEYKKSVDYKKMNILDVGCGEGFHIYSIFQKVKENQNNTYVEVDISKDSINIAARNNADIIWCIADLARLPFQNKSFDVILNILSPANYGEFERILNDKGIVIKVVPRSNYLKELRETIYIDNDVSDYSNSKVINYFKQKLDVEDIQNINYKFDISKEFLPHFIKMTPLTWGKSTERLNDVYKKNISSITVDLTLIIGTKKK